MIKLVKGDCREYLERLGPGSIDLVLTDPPYGTTYIPWDKLIDVDLFWCQVRRILKPAGIAVVFAAQPFAVELINANRKAFRYELVWEKPAPVGFLDANRRPLRSHELILVFTDRFQESCYDPQLIEGDWHTVGRNGNTTLIYGDHARSQTRRTNLWHPRSVLRYGKDPDRLHPTQKPVALLEFLIRSYSHEGDVVLDPYMGVGSTALAALHCNRHFLGIEIDAEYHHLAKQRLAKQSISPAACSTSQHCQNSRGGGAKIV